MNGRVTPIPHLPVCFPAGATFSGVLIKEMGVQRNYHSVTTLELVPLNSLKNTFIKMAFKLAVLSVLLAVANAGFYSAPAAVEYHAPAVEYHAAPAVAVGHGPLASAAVGSQTQSVYRSADGNHAVSHYTKAVDTAFSSVRKYDTRVSNDAVALAHAPAIATVAHAPAVATVAHAPAVATVAHAPAIAYSAPAISHAPAVATIAHAPAVATVSHAPAVAYTSSYAPTYAASYAPAVAKVAAAPASLLGVSYSAAPAVAHLSYSNGYGINYHY